MRRKLMAVAMTLAVSIGLVAAGTTTADAHTRSTVKVGYTQVVVAPAVYALIAGAGIAPAPLDGAKAYAYKGTLAANFPIVGYDLRKVRIKHSGGLSLTAGSATIELRNFYIDLGRGRVSGTVKGTVGNVGRVDLFKIRFPDSRLGLVRLTLTSTAAGALNATFGVKAFAENATFGYATPKPLSRF